jgi:hypothetical protein
MNNTKRLSTIPLPIGETPIPPGRERRFHYTYPENVPGIMREGLKVNKSKGSKYGDPAGIWSEGEKYKESYKNQVKPVVEFHSPPEHWNGLPYSFHDVPPENIVAIHHPWHQTYHYIKENGVSMKNVERVKNDPQYKMAYEQLKREGYTGKQKNKVESSLDKKINLLLQAIKNES